MEGWSNVDFITWNLPPTSAAAATLYETVGKAAHRHSQRASLHLADLDGGDAHRTGPLYNMKMRAVLRRVGLDTAVIAGAAPTTTATPKSTDPALDDGSGAPRVLGRSSGPTDAPNEYRIPPQTGERSRDHHG
ncbi:hypothetical protein [Micromonospora sp. NPDC023814]|uniref:hypothetical protein n=1 Tax=Micromonospora sp. NPDC023814 TaxID=3154596 RepID=UPI003403A96A